MKHKKWVAPAVFFFLVLVYPALAQTKKINEKDLFKDEKLIEIKLSTDIKGLQAEKKDLNYINASIRCMFPDSTVVEGPVRIKPRGHFRKDNCRFAPLTINFKNEGSPAFSKLGALKLVVGCGVKSIDEQNVLKEYLVYKIYNLLTDMSFRVRLLHVNYNDTKGKVKDWSQYAFLMEDMDELAKRNKCKQKSKVRYAHNLINREQATLVYLFQYMIGNTDWSIPYYHNFKLMVEKKDTISRPYPVAYDFDITGLVNPSYGAPPPDLGIESITERLYRGHKRTLEEIETAVKLFLDKKEAIYSLINNFSYLQSGNKKEMITFLDGFFDEIKNTKNLKRIFVDNALVQ